MEKEFAKKILLITGATSGIGKATALRFAQAGASIAAVGRDEQAMLELQNRSRSQERNFSRSGPICRERVKLTPSSLRLWNALVGSIC